MFFLRYDNGKEAYAMKTVLKILLFPFAVFIDLVIWIFVGLLSCSAFVFSLASTVLGILALVVLLTCSVTNGLILLVLAFIVSPMGLPLLATKLLSGLQYVSVSIKGI